MSQDNDITAEPGGDPGSDGYPRRSIQSWMLAQCPQIRHSEVLERLATGGSVKSAIIEAQDDGPDVLYAAFVLVSWRPGYQALRLRWPAEPRLFRDLDRLVGLLRIGYKFKGPVALTIATPEPDKSNTRMGWRVGV